MKPSRAILGRVSPMGAHFSILAGVACAFLLGILDAEGQSAWSPHVLSTSLDGHLIAIAAPGGKVCVWDAKSRRLAHSFVAGKAVKAVSITQAGDAICCGAGNAEGKAEVDFWDLKPDGPSLRWKAPINEQANAVAISWDSKWIAAVTPAATIRFFDADRGQLRKTLRERGNEMLTCAFLPKRFALATGGQTLRLWDLQRAGLRVDSIEASSPSESEYIARERDSLVSSLGSMATSLCVAPNGKWIAAIGSFHASSQGRPENLVLVDQRSGKLAKTLASRLDDVKCLAAAPDSEKLAVVFDDGRLEIWNVVRAERARLVRTGIHNARAGVFVGSPDVLAIADAEGNVEVWDVSRSAKLYGFKAG